MYTVDEKLKYCATQFTDFADGYIKAVKMYRDYPNKSEFCKKLVKGTIERADKGAKNGHEFSKGMMCGFRDAANERKARNKD